MEPIDAYHLFNSVKLHYKQDSYDFFRYNGRVSITQTKFECRNDKYHYYKLSKRDNARQLVIFNLFENPDLWIGELFSDECKSICRKRLGITSSMERNFTIDLKRYDSLDDALNINNGDYPSILEDYTDGNVSPETLYILNLALNDKLFSYWRDNLNDRVFWPMKQNLISKYGRFLLNDFNINVKKYKQLLVDIYQ